MISIKFNLLLAIITTSVTLVIGEEANDGSVRSDHQIIAIRGMAIAVYKNGTLIDDSKRKVLGEESGGSIEKIDTSLVPGDWLVFHLVNRNANNPSFYFGMVGQMRSGDVTFVSDSQSQDWSSCDFPSLVNKFTTDREFGRQSKIVAIEEPWAEGDKMFSGHLDAPFQGTPIWGTAPSTWIKYCVPDEPGEIVERESNRVITRVLPVVPMATEDITIRATQNKVSDRRFAISDSPEWPVQILSAIYGSGARNADVTDRVRDLVENQRVYFAANPHHLKADPCPGWNKNLRIRFMKDGKIRSLSRNENGGVAPEAFYGPQDAVELEKWLVHTRWAGSNGEIQFHPNGVLAGPNLDGEASWKVVSERKVEITWAEATEATAFGCDSILSQMSSAGEVKQTYRILRQPSSPATFSIDKKEIDRLVPSWFSAQ